MNVRNIQGVPTFNYRLKTLPVTFVRDCRDILINNSMNYCCTEKTFPNTTYSWCTSSRNYCKPV